MKTKYEMFWDAYERLHAKGWDDGPLTEEACRIVEACWQEERPSREPRYAKTGNLSENKPTDFTVRFSRQLSISAQDLKRGMEQMLHKDIKLVFLDEEDPVVWHIKGVED